MTTFRKGTSLIELLIGVAIFSTLLSFAALGVRYSDQILQATNRSLDADVILQRGLDDAARVIRGCVSVQGGGTALQCQDQLGNMNTLSIVNRTLMLNQIPLETNLDAINFSIVPGEVAPYVTIQLTTSTNRGQLGTTTDTLSTSVALRESSAVVAAAAPPSPAPASSSPTPPTATPAAPTPSPTRNCPMMGAGWGPGGCLPVPPGMFAEAHCGRGSGCY